MLMRTVRYMIGAMVVAVAAAYAGYYAGAFDTEYVQRSVAVLEDIARAEPRERVLHVPTPEPVKAIYMTQCVVGTPSFRGALVELIETTELNAVIIDIKDFSGRIAFPTEHPVLAPSGIDGCGAYDMKDFIASLHEKEIYVIGRITVFQDPHYTALHPESAVRRASDGGVWKDYKGLSFVDVGAKSYWEFVAELSKESYALGFDELNYDYVRYPSDGNMKDIAFTHSGGRPKADVLEDFFAYLYDALEDTGAKLSVDLFGYTTTNTDDLGIGQIIERALPYFDYVMPMVYPSHYNDGFIGIANPAAHPYEVVHYSMSEAVRRAEAVEQARGSTSTSTETIALQSIGKKGHQNINKDQLRPWLQDFDLGASYTPDMVRTQIQATYDAGLTSWALWDAGNTYTRAALLDE